MAENIAMNGFQDFYLIKALISRPLHPALHNKRRAERDNKSLVETAKAMLYAKSLPTRLWAEAMNMACYI